MSESIANHENNYRDFNQIKYFENKTIDYHQKILTEIKNDLEQLDKELRNSTMRKQKSTLLKVMYHELSLLFMVKLLF